MNKTLVVYGNIEADVELVEAKIIYYKINTTHTLEDAGVQSYDVDITNGVGKFTINVNDEDFLGKDVVLEVGTDLRLSVNTVDIHESAYIRYFTVTIEEDIEIKPTIQYDIKFTEIDKVICYGRCCE